MKTGVLLINLGTPDSPQVADVRRYLFQFLNDKRVIDLPWLVRKILVNLIIVPFRSPKSAKAYQSLWTATGSPLKHYGESVKRELQQNLGDEFHVELAMRYQNPSLPDVLKSMEKESLKHLIIVPLFPQYASSSTGSAAEEALRIVRLWNVIPTISMVGQFYQDEGFLNCVASNGRKYLNEQYDHVLFSFHGLPVRHLENGHKSYNCDNCGCTGKLNRMEPYCYKNTCYETARLLAHRLSLQETNYTVVFQSRLGREPWIEPYADETIKSLARRGKKRVLVFSPAFVADCLETSIEIGEEFAHLFKAEGGEHLQLVESLNDNPEWVSALGSLVRKQTISG